MAKRLVLSDEIAKRRESDQVEIDIGDDDPIVIDPPDLWGDDIVEALRSSDTDTEVCTIVLGGEGNYDRYRKAGGTSALLLTMYREAVGELGESSAS